MSAPKQLLYIGDMYDKVKLGITGNNKTRMSGYGKGNHQPMIYWLGFADDAHIEHIVDCEKYLIRALAPYLEKPNGVLTEYVDPKHKNITLQYVVNLVEQKIKDHPLKIRRLKAEFLPITKYDKNLMDGIRAFPDKYLEEVS